MQTNRSEVARLLGQIDSEISAMQLAMHGFASVARHEIITHRFANLDTCYQALVGQIGEQEALEAITKKLEAAI